LTDKSRNTTSTISVSKIASTPFMQLSGSFQLVENRMYSFEVKDGTDVVYKGLIFCTDQSDYSKYDTSEGEYTVEDSFNNEFHFIGETAGGGGGTGVSICYNTDEMDAADSIFQAVDLYCVTVDGETYDDWYVPSKDDLTQISTNLTLIQIGLRANTGYQDIEQGGVVNGFIKLKQYFASTEANAAEAWILALPKTSGSGIGTDLKQPIETVLNYLTEFRPVRFATSAGALEAGEKYGGGIVGGTTTVDGVSGYLIVSPTRVSGTRDWSNLGNTVTGATDNTDGKANTDTVLALENA